MVLVSMLNQDTIVDILSRLDGRSLTATASTCADLRDAACRDQVLLWQKLCHTTWPSITMENSPFQTSAAANNNGGFQRLYADAFPLLLAGANPKPIATGTTTQLQAIEFTSLIDIYYRGQCIFSKVIQGLAGSETSLSYPFKLDLLERATRDTMSKLLPPPSAFRSCYDEREDHLNITQDIRLSWILLNTRTGKAANLSSWKPRSIHKGNPIEMEYTMHFGCTTHVKDCLVPYSLGECVITAKGRLMLDQGCISWKEISLVIKDVEGSHLNGEQSMRFMNQALICRRSTDHSRVKKAHQQLEKRKVLLRLRAEQQETVANVIGAILAIATLLSICCASAVLFSPTSS